LDDTCKSSSIIPRKSSKVSGFTISSKYFGSLPTAALREDAVLPALFKRSMLPALFKRSTGPFSPGRGEDSNPAETFKAVSSSS
jgi:hypothetical protein